MGDDQARTGARTDAKGGCAWRGSELFARADWRLGLSPEESAELVEAVAATAGRPRGELTARDFRLPLLTPRLEHLSRGLERGSGVTRLTGLDLDSLAGLGIADAAERAFWALATRLGTPVSQSAEGERLLPVRDAGHGADDPRVRGPNTNRRLRFHTDRCDVIAFLCVRPAASGGETHVLSSIALAEELRRRHPEAFEVLRRPFPYLRHTVDQGNDRPYVELPVFSERDGYFAASLLRVLIDRAHADPGAPDLTAEQVDALDTLEAVAEDPGLYASFTLERGDVLLLNNWTTFHRRTAFRDVAEPGRRRLLLRLWLSVPGSRPIDPRFADHFGATEAGALRGGMRPRREPRG